MHGTPKMFLWKSIPLSETTRDALKNAGFKIIRRNRKPSDLPSLLPPNSVVINYGDSTFPDLPELEVWNKAENISKVITPGEARNTLNDFLPSKPHKVPVTGWEKGPGRSGKNKKQQTFYCPPPSKPNYDHQIHIDGMEYRIISVGPKIVQCSLKSAGIYNWVPMADVPKHTKRLVRKATQTIPGLNIFGWDVIAAVSRSYILEANSSPGLNIFSAQRIKKAMDTHYAS